MRLQQDGEFGVRQDRFARQRHRDGFAHPSLLALTGDEGLVQPAARFFGHAERAIAKAGGDVLRRGAEARDLVVVDGGRAVHGEVGHDLATHQLDDDRREAGLHDVAA